MADGFDVVAVWVSDEGAVVTRVVLGPEPRLVEHVGSLRHGGVEEGPHGRPVGSVERDVGLTETLAGLERPDPERCSYGLSSANCRRGSCANTSLAT